MIEFRPKVRFTYDDSPEGIITRVREQARRNNPARLVVEKTDGSLLLSFPPEKAEIWSAQMELHLDAKGDGRTYVRAIFGPKQSIWTIFRTALLLIASLGVIGLVLGFIQFINKQIFWGFYLAVAGLCAGLFVWFLSEEGKRRAHDEMGLLRTFMDHALGTTVFSVAEKRAPITYGRVA